MQPACAVSAISNTNKGNSTHWVRHPIACTRTPLLTHLASWQVVVLCQLCLCALQLSLQLVVLPGSLHQGMVLQLREQKAEEGAYCGARHLRPRFLNIPPAFLVLHSTFCFCYHVVEHTSTLCPNPSPSCQRLGQGSISQHKDRQTLPLYTSNKLLHSRQSTKQGVQEAAAP